MPNKLSKLTFKDGAINAIEATQQMLSVEGKTISTIAFSKEYVLAQKGRQSLRLKTELLLAMGGLSDHAVGWQSFQDGEVELIPLLDKNGNIYKLSKEQFIYALDNALSQNEKTLFGYHIRAQPAFYYADSSGNRTSDDFYALKDESIEDLLSKGANDITNHFNSLSPAELKIRAYRESAIIKQALNNGGCLEWKYPDRLNPDDFTVTYYAPSGLNVQGSTSLRLNTKQTNKLANPLKS